MTVGELIAELQKYSAEQSVGIHFTIDGEWSASEILNVEENPFEIFGPRILLKGGGA